MKKKKQEYGSIIEDEGIVAGEEDRPFNLSLSFSPIVEFPQTSLFPFFLPQLVGHLASMSKGNTLLPTTTTTWFFPYMFYTFQNLRGQKTKTFMSCLPPATYYQIGSVLIDDDKNTLIAGGLTVLDVPITCQTITLLNCITPYFLLSQL